MFVFTLNICMIKPDSLDSFKPIGPEYFEDLLLICDDERVVRLLKRLFYFCMSLCFIESK